MIRREDGLLQSGVLSTVLRAFRMTISKAKWEHYTSRDEIPGLVY